MGCIRTELRTTSGETGDGDGERQTHYAHGDVDKRGGGVLHGDLGVKIN